METIKILAEAIAKANKTNISSINFQYNLKEDNFTGYLILGNGLKYAIFEDCNTRNLSITHSSNA